MTSNMKDREKMADINYCQACEIQQKVSSEQMKTTNKSSRSAFGIEYSIKFCSSLLLVLLLLLFPQPLNGEESSPVYILQLTKAKDTFSDNSKVRQKRSLSTGNLGGTPGQGYFIQMGVGTPQQMVSTWAFSTDQI